MNFDSQSTFGYESYGTDQASQEILDEFFENPPRIETMAPKPPTGANKLQPPPSNTSLVDPRLKKSRKMKLAPIEQPQAGLQPTPQVHPPVKRKKPTALGHHQQQEAKVVDLEAEEEEEEEDHNEEMAVS